MVHSVAVVCADTCTVLEAPAARSPNEQLRLLPVIEQLPAPVPPSITQVRPPVGFGSGSDSVTFFAVPAPLFVSVSRNPIGSPAFTGEASAVFVNARLAWLQVIDASAVENACAWLL